MNYVSPSWLSSQEYLTSTCAYTCIHVCNLTCLDDVRESSSAEGSCDFIFSDTSLIAAIPSLNGKERSTMKTMCVIIRGTATH